MTQWLMSELQALAAPTEIARFALDMANQRVSLVERTLSGRKHRGEAEHGTPDFEDLIETMRQRVARRHGREAPVDLLLPPELTLTRVETFPAEARRDLRDEVWWRLESITPYNAEDLCYDAAIVGVEPKTGFLDVSVAIAPREIVEEAIAYARKWGFAPQRVSASADIEGFPHGPVFLEAANQRREMRSLKRTAAGLIAASTLMGVIGAGAAVLERQQIADRLEARAAELDSQLAVDLETRASALDLAQRAGRPGARSQEQYNASAWVRALEEAAPPDVVINRLTLVDGMLRIEGATSNADAALAALEQSEAFETPRHAAPILSAGAGGAVGKEQFAIEARIAAPSSDKARVAAKAESGS